MIVVLGWLLAAFNSLVLVYFGVINAVYGLLAIRAVGSLRRHIPSLRTFSALEPTLVAATPPMTVIAPAYNEAPTCASAVRSLLALDYPDHEILVVNDGSKDDTLERLVDAFDLIRGIRAPTTSIPTARIRGIYTSRLHPNLWVIDKENGGKADALNAGTNYTVTPLFCAVDADSLLERDSLMRMVRPFLEDSSTVAAGGMIRLVNDCTVKGGVVTHARVPKSFLVRFQVVEYLRAFLLGHVGWASINASLVISGAFGVFRRSTVAAAGGYASRHNGRETVGEDMELVVRLKRHCHETGVPCRVAFVPDAVAWTEAPETLEILGRQRDRWQRGLYESTSRHRRLLFNPAYGLTGLLAFPHFFLLELVGPAIELAGYVVFAFTIFMGLASPGHIVAFFTMAFLLGILVTFIAVALEEFSFHRYKGRGELLRLLLAAILEGFGYRQLTVFWRVRGLVKIARGDKEWGEMTRRGFKLEPASPRASMAAPRDHGAGARSATQEPAVPQPVE